MIEFNIKDYEEHFPLSEEKQNAIIAECCKANNIEIDQDAAAIIHIAFDFLNIGYRAGVKRSLEEQIMLDSQLFNKICEEINIK